MNEKRKLMYKELTSLHGVSMNEDEVRKYMYNKLSLYTNEFVYDGLGSVFGKFGNKGPTILIAAHMDEVGAFVAGFKDNGLIKIELLGGINNDLLIGQCMVLKVDDQYIKGVISSTPPHLDKKSEELLFDIGAFSKEEVLSYKIKVGDVLTFENNYFETYNKKNFSNKALDDRVGCAIVLEVAKLIKNANLNSQVYIGGSIAEEVGLYGGNTITSVINPDIFVAVDISPSDEHIKESSVRIGGGVLIRHTDPGNIMPVNARIYIEKVASKNKILLQDYFAKGRTDAASAQYQNSGCVSFTLAICAKYIHSPVGMINYDDIDSLVKLIHKFIISIDENSIKKVRVV